MPFQQVDVLVQCVVPVQQILEDLQHVPVVAEVQNFEDLEITKRPVQQVETVEIAKAPAQQVEALEVKSVRVGSATHHNAVEFVVQLAVQQQGQQESLVCDEEGDVVLSGRGFAKQAGAYQAPLSGWEDMSAI